jgi:hypothetical protein
MKIALMFLVFVSQQSVNFLSIYTWLVSKHNSFFAGTRNVGRDKILQSDPSRRDVERPRNHRTMTELGRVAEDPFFVDKGRDPSGCSHSQREYRRPPDAGHRRRGQRRGQRQRGGRFASSQI